MKMNKVFKLKYINCSKTCENVFNFSLKHKKVMNERYPGGKWTIRADIK